MAILFKKDPKASEWASRNNATELYVTHPSGDDIAYANGQMIEFDEVLDYVDATEQRSQRTPNAYIAESKQAEGEANVIMAAYYGAGERAERAQQRLIELGYAE